jgi:hypothetical protein
VAFTCSAVTSPCLGSWIKSAGADPLNDSKRERV